MHHLVTQVIQLVQLRAGPYVSLLVPITFEHASHSRQQAIRTNIELPTLVEQQIAEVLLHHERMILILKHTCYFFEAPTYLDPLPAIAVFSRLDNPYVGFLVDTLSLPKYSCEAFELLILRRSAVEGEWNIPLFLRYVVKGVVAGEVAQQRFLIPQVEVTLEVVMH